MRRFVNDLPLGATTAGLARPGGAESGTSRVRIKSDVDESAGGLKRVNYRGAVAHTSPAISSVSLKRTTWSSKALSRAVRSALARDLVDGRCLRALDLVPIDSPNSRGSDGILRDMTVARRPAFARDPTTAAYYDQCAAEYDEWYLGTGKFASRNRPGWNAEVDNLVELVRGLPAVRTLDIACGSGFLTRHLSGLVVGLDQSRSMVDLAQSRLPDGVVMVGDALDLPFADDSFDRILIGHFYGHLPPDERELFLAEARRVAGELVVVDAALRDDLDPEQWEERVLNDGSRHQVFKRYFRSQQLAAEVGGQVMYNGAWFVVARTTWSARRGKIDTAR